MIIVAKTPKGVLICQVLNRVHLVNVVQGHGISLADVRQYSFLGQDSVYDQIKELIQEKEVASDLYNIDLATLTYIEDLLEEHGKN